MKNVLKTIATLAASLLAFGACQGELEQPEQPKVTHTVTFVAGAPETKTTAAVNGNSVNYSWTSEDAKAENFTIYESGSKVSNIEPSLGENGNMILTATFEGEAPAQPKYTGYFNSGVQETQEASCNNGVQKYDQLSDVLVAKASEFNTDGTINFSFARLVAFGEVTLTGLSGTNLKKVTIESLTDKAYLAGTLKENIYANREFGATYEYNVNDFENLSKVITINCSNAITGGSATLRFVSLPISGARLRFIVETTDGGETITHYYDKSFKEGATIDFTQGNLTGFPVSCGESEISTAKVFFYESFNTNKGTGGNDNLWSGSIASGDLVADNGGWEFVKGSRANACAKFGTGSALGSATTPSIDITTPTAKLMFKAAAWDGSSEVTTLNLSATGANLSNSSSVTLVKGQWNIYTVDITEISGNVKIKFEAKNASNNRFFLDEVYVYYGPKVNPTITATNKEITLNEGQATQDLTEMFESNSNGAITYALKEASTTASISGSTFTATAAGTYTIVASQAETETYNTGSAEAMITVNEGGAGPKSYTITFNKDSGDGSAASTSTQCSLVVSDGADYLNGNLATATKVYYGGGSGLKLGASSSAGTIKMNLSSKGQVNCKSIVVRAKLYNSSKTATLKVNDSATQNLATDFADYTYNITGNLSYLELVSSKYCWVESITVNY